MGISERQLETWAQQGNTGQFTDTYKSIRGNLLDGSAPYPAADVGVFLQGSYGNDTNVWADSDVDIVLKHTGAYYPDVSQLPAPSKSILLVASNSRQLTNSMRLAARNAHTDTPPRLGAVLRCPDRRHLLRSRERAFAAGSAASGPGTQRVFEPPCAGRDFQIGICQARSLRHKQPFNGTPAVHDHNPVGAKLHPGATSIQSPCRCTTTSGVPLTSESTAGPLGIVRTFSPSAGTVTNKVPQLGSPQFVYPPNTQPSGGGGGTATTGGAAGGSGA